MSETTMIARTLIAALQFAAEQKDRDANQLDRWAEQSRTGGWSTHQVEPMTKLADKLRREAAGIRGTVADAARRVEQ